VKVVVVYPYYQGHGAPGHSLIHELAQHLAAGGHEITVIAGETGYMRRERPTLPWYRRLLRREQAGGVRVVRTFTYAELHRSYRGRLLSFLSFSLSGPLALLTAPRPEVVLLTSPPLFPMFAAGLVCRLRRLPFVLEVRDLWPASAVQLGIVHHRALIAIMAGMEGWLYRRARRIVALTEGIRADIAARGWPLEKMDFIPCGVDLALIHPDPAGAAAIRARHGWEGRRIALYFGALGEANNLPVVLRAAARLRGHPGLLFVLVGDGMKRQALEEERQAQGLDNVQILPPVPKEEARFYLSAADVCLVTLRDIPLFAGAIPTKLIDALACARPVLCGVRGEAQRIVEEAGAGWCFAPDDDRQLSELILALIGPGAEGGQETEDGPAAAAARMGQRGLALARERYAAPIMRQRWEGVLRAAAGLPAPLGGAGAAHEGPGT
jgi:glycosyltransferase involved in cell wall biosynthesis